MKQEKAEKQLLKLSSISKLWRANEWQGTTGQAGEHNQLINWGGKKGPETVGNDQTLNFLGNLIYYNF